MSVQESCDLLVAIRQRLQQEKAGTWEQFSATLMASGNGRLPISESIDGITVILSGHHDLLVRMAQFYPLNLRIHPRHLFLSDCDRAWYDEVMNR